MGILLPGSENGKKKKKKRKTKAKAKDGEKVVEEKKPPKPVVVTAENIFEPTLEVIPGKVKVIADLRKAAENAPNVYLATDPDREGEAISQHLLDTLATKKSDRAKYRRVMFNEITPKAIKAAFAKAGDVNADLVDAQQARRVLDRLVGYKISPILWNKVRRGLSAGRVQTVALRLIVEREVQIRAFVPQEYWSIHAMLDAGEPPIFEAKLFKHKGEDMEVGNQESADAIVAAVSNAKWQVASVSQKEKRRNPPPPFTTSKLQQAAYNRLRYTAKRTMSLAQKLYEGVELGEEGSVALITYMRTDSVNVSADALAQVREMIPERFGSNYLPESRITTNPKKTRRKLTKRCAPPTPCARLKMFANIWKTIFSSCIN